MRRPRRKATIDPLTGSHNRRQLESVLKREISFAQREGHLVELILVDLDRFKQLNDTCGHTAGDAAKPSKRPRPACCAYARSSSRAASKARVLRVADGPRSGAGRADRVHDRRRVTTGKDEASLHSVPNRD